MNDLVVHGPQRGAAKTQRIPIRPIHVEAAPALPKPD